MARSRASANYTITATDRTRAGIQSAKASLGGLDNLAAKLGVSFSILGAAGVAAPGAIISAQAPLIDQMGKLATQTGASVEFIQAYRREAELAGVSTGQFDDAMEKMARNLADAKNGTGEARDALDALGLSAQAIAQLNPEDQFYAISEAMAGITTEGEKAALAADIFGRSGTSLIRVQGEQIRQTKEEMIALNAVLNGAEVRGVEAMNDALTLTKANATIAAQVFTAQMAPAITGVTESIFGAGKSMEGFRDVSLTTANVFVDVIGAIGNGIEGIDNVISGVAIGLQELNVLAGKAGALFGSDGAEERLSSQLQILQEMKDNLAGQTGDATFWTQLEDQVAAARAEAELAGQEMDALRAKVQGGIDVSLNVGESNLGSTSIAQPNDSAFDSLLDSLSLGTEKIDREYAKRLGVIDDFRTSFPDRANEALQAEIAAMEARDKAVEDYEQQRKDKEDQERESSLEPLEANYEDVRKQFQGENEIIIEEYENRKALLEDLASLDLERRAEINELLVQLAQDKEDRIAQIEQQAVSKRVQIQAGYAAQALGVAASLVDSIAGQGEKGKRIAARISQAEALVAGISAAERARNHAALTGGVVSGGAAAALSWASTLANVAGIEAALNGGSPGGVSSSSGVSPGGTSGDIRSNLSSGGDDAQAINVTFVLDETIFNRSALESMAINGVAKSTQSRDLTYNMKRGYFERNTEAATA